MHSLRLFAKLSFSVVHEGTSGQQRGDRGIQMEDTPYIKKRKDMVDHVAMGQPGEGKRRGMAWGNPVG